MDLLINGQLETYPPLNNLEELRAQLRLPDYGVAIELNGLVIPKKNYSQTPLTPNDRLEIVRLVGGG